MFVLKEKNTGEKFEFFDLNTQENGKFNFCVTEHLRHMACSIIEINICSKHFCKRSLFTKRLKKLYCNQSCANLYYKYAQSNLYWVLKFQIGQKN